MRFKDLSQEATQTLWTEWKCLIREFLDEFNDDVFGGTGSVRENKYDERYYLLLEAKEACLYVFPVPGKVLIFCVYHHKIPKERLNSKFAANKPDEENLIGWKGLDVRGVELQHWKTKKPLRTYLESVLRKIYRNYWITLSS